MATCISSSKQDPAGWGGESGLALPVQLIGVPNTKHKTGCSSPIYSNTTSHLFYPPLFALHPAAVAGCVDDEGAGWARSRVAQQQAGVTAGPG